MYAILRFFCIIYILQEVAVKRFLDQDIFGESLEEFKSEVGVFSAYLFNALSRSCPVFNNDIVRLVPAKIFQLFSLVTYKY